VSSAEPRLDTTRTYVHRSARDKVRFTKDDTYAMSPVMVSRLGSAHFDAILEAVSSRDMERE